VKKDLEDVKAQVDSLLVKLETPAGLDKKPGDLPPGQSNRPTTAPGVQSDKETPPGLAKKPGDLPPGQSNRPTPAPMDAAGVPPPIEGKKTDNVPPPGKKPEEWNPPGQEGKEDRPTEEPTDVEPDKETPYGQAKKADAALLPPGQEDRPTPAPVDIEDDLNAEVVEAEAIENEIEVLDELKEITADLETRVKGPPPGKGPPPDKGPPPGVRGTPAPP
jgi:hypothetical protein